MLVLFFEQESYPSSSSTPLNHEANHSQASELDKKTGQSGTSLVASSICVPEEEEERTTIGIGNHRTPHFSIGDSDIGPEPVVIHEDVPEEAVEDQQSLSVQESNELSAIPEEEVVLKEGAVVVKGLGEEVVLKEEAIVKGSGEEVVLKEGAVVKGSGEEVGSVEGGNGGGEVEVGVTDASGGTKVEVEIVRDEEGGEGSVRSEDTGTVVGAAMKSEVGDAGVKSEPGESGEGDEKHEDMPKESAEKMDLSEVPSVLTTSSEGEVAEGDVAEGEVAEGEVTQEEVRAC